MSYINKSVTNYGKEPAFIEAFIASLASADNRIIREQTPEEISAMFATGTNSKPEFSFLINGIGRITFRRGQGITDNEQSFGGYFVRFSYGDATSSWLTVKFTSSTIGFAFSGTRIFKYQIISNQKAIFIRFGDYNSTFPLTTSCKGLIYSDTANQINFLMINTGACYVGNEGTVCTKVTRLPYMRSVDDITQIEVIKNIALVGDSNELIINPDGIWDATTNYTTNVPLQIGNEQCCFLDTNTVMKC